jgi:hypothetical protein
MKINKITCGFVVQTYDTELQKWTEQEFVAGDQSEYELAGTFQTLTPVEIWPDLPEPYLPFLMRQPEEIGKEQNPG